MSFKSKLLVEADGAVLALAIGATRVLSIAVPPSPRWAPAGGGPAFLQCIRGPAVCPWQRHQTIQGCPKQTSSTAPSRSMS